AILSKRRPNQGGTVPWFPPRKAPPDDALNLDKSVRSKLPIRSMNRSGTAATSRLFKDAMVIRVNEFQIGDRVKLVETARAASGDASGAFIALIAAAGRSTFELSALPARLRLHRRWRPSLKKFQHGGQWSLLGAAKEHWAAFFACARKC